MTSSLNEISARPGPSSSGLNYAIVFRTHFWDDFAQRQLKRIRSRATHGDIFVLVDETRGRVEDIAWDKVYRLTDEDIVAAGFVALPGKSAQWYSGDVPLYLFHMEHPEYDYYLYVEYDVGVQVDLDDLVRRLEASNVDVLALTNKDAIEVWPWRSTCLPAYEPSEVKHFLICFSAFSKKALELLYQRRLEQARRFNDGSLSQWPYCEGYLASEAHLQGLVVDQLANFGDVECYDSFPPYVESDLSQMRDRSFVHPLLSSERYLSSLFKRPVGLRALLMPTSWLHRKLRRLGLAGYTRSIATGVLVKELREGLSGFRRKK